LSAAIKICPLTVTAMARRPSRKVNGFPVPSLLNSRRTPTRVTVDRANPFDGSADHPLMPVGSMASPVVRFRVTVSTMVNVRTAGDQKLWECRRIAPTPGTCAKRNAE
jgi:hypothetical protein